MVRTSVRQAVPHRLAHALRSMRLNTVPRLPTSQGVAQAGRDPPAASAEVRTGPNSIRLFGFSQASWVEQSTVPHPRRLDDASEKADTNENSFAHSRHPTASIDTCYEGANRYELFVASRKQEHPNTVDYPKENSQGVLLFVVSLGNQEAGSLAPDPGKITRQPPR